MSSTGRLCSKVNLIPPVCFSTDCNEKSEKSEYRNAVRSYGLICNVLLKLLDEKPFDKITIYGPSSIASC